MWIYLGILSALFLGLYDICKKWSLRENAVLVVLFLSTCFGAMLTLPVFVASRVVPESMSAYGLYADWLSSSEHLYIIAKAVLVSASWISAFFALKHLPISIVTPIRASAPLWTLVGAVVLFGETFKALHWLAMGFVFGSYYVFSVLGKKEGIHFFRDKWVLLVLVATLTGALSALYDKYLLHTVAIPRVTLQVWFSFYLVVFNGIIVLFLWWMGKSRFQFQWRFSVPLIGVLLIIADFVYFYALSQPDALIAILSLVRRSSAIISFILGGLIFGEQNKRKKLIPLVGIAAGIVLLVITA